MLRLSKSSRSWKRNQTPATSNWVY